MYIHIHKSSRTCKYFYRVFEVKLLASQPTFPKEQNLRQTFQVKKFLRGKIPAYEERERKRGDAGKEEKQTKDGTVTKLASLTEVTQDVF